LLAGLTTVAGCKTLQSVDSASVPLIVGGHELEADNPGRKSAVVLLANDRFRCSAVVVAENLIATAAHCLQNQPAEDFTVLFGDSVRSPTATRRVVEVRQFRRWGPYSSAHFDMAWLKIDGVIPEDHAPAEILSDPARLTKDVPLTIVGYGRTSSSASDYGSRLAVDSVFNRHENSKLWRNVFVTGPTPGKGTCQGDSGGPAYARIGGKWYLVGVNYGTPPELFASIRCEDGQNVETFIGAYKSWIAASSGGALSGEAVVQAPPQDAVRGTGFLAWCEAASLSYEAWYTVVQVMRALGATDCADGAARLAQATSLNLNSRAVSDLRPLAGSTNIERLILVSNSVQDLTPVATLTNLRVLNLRENQVTDLTPLAGLQRLESLVIHENQVASLEPLARSSALKEVYAGCNKIAAITPLSTVTNLRVASFPVNVVRSLEPLLALKTLENVNAQYNPLDSDAAIASLEARPELLFAWQAEGDPIACGDGRWPIPPALGR
jgi:hypothetical protein